jgi:hypothetical protein
VSTSQTTTDYQVQLNVEGHGAQLFATFAIAGQLGVDDATALAFVQTLQDFAWPVGTSVDVQVNKATTTSVFFTTHLDTDPPVFT